MIRREQRMVIYGTTRSGKSQLARAIWIGMAAPRVLFDVKDDLGPYLPGIPTIDSPGEVFDRPTQRIVPPDPSDARFYDECCKKIFEHGDCFVWLDEFNEMTSPNAIPRDVRRVVLQGQGREIGVVGLTPRPQDVHGSLAAQAMQLFCFELEHPRDRDHVAGLMNVNPVELNAMLDSMPQFHCVHRDRHEKVPAKVIDPGVDPDLLTRQIASRFFGNWDDARLRIPKDSL